MLIGGAVIYTLGVVLWSVGALFLGATGFPMMGIQAISLDTDVVLEYFLDELQWLLFHILLLHQWCPAVVVRMPVHMFPFLCMEIEGKRGKLDEFSMRVGV